jgi:transcription elongation factor GreA
MARHQLTQAAFDRLQSELYDLTTRGRIEVSQKIERARELGDLSENGDYHAAKDEQGHMEGRIRQLEAMLEEGNYEIVAAPDRGVVGIGTVVEILYEGDDPDMSEKYFLGHIEEELDDLDIMSPNSPLGSALQGRKVQEWVEYDGPNGRLKVQIVSVEVHSA